MPAEISLPFQTRDIGDIFDYEGNQLRVEQESSDRACSGCFFDNSETSSAGCYKNTIITGLCSRGHRTDNKGVRFVYVPDTIEQTPTPDVAKALPAEPEALSEQPLTKRETVALEFAKTFIATMKPIEMTKAMISSAIDNAFDSAEYFLEKSGSREKYDETKHPIHRIKRPTQK